MDATLLAYMTSLFASSDAVQLREGSRRKGIVANTNRHLKQLLAIVNDLESIFRRQRMVDCVEYCLIAKDALSKPSVDIASVSASLTTLKSSILQSVQKKKLLHVAKDRFEFAEEDALFGPAVKAAFPSAHRDVRAAVECFAAECSAAAVFHLMRVVEVGLRGLLRDRRIPLFDRHLGEKDWSMVLKRLEVSIFELRAAPLAKWIGGAPVKERQIAFYTDVLLDLRAFDDAWKTHVSHPGAAVFYSHDQAGQILTHVRSFMQKLAARLAETTATEEFWPR